MLKFDAQFFVNAANQLSGWEIKAGQEQADTLVRPDLLQTLEDGIANFRGECADHGLRSTNQQCARIQETLKLGLKCGSLWSDLRDLRRRFEDDLELALFLHLSPDEADQYKNPTREWKAVVKRFPDLRINIEESSKCFAVGRYAASLFHALLVAEFGVIELAKVFGAEGDKPGWGCLDRLQRIDSKAFKHKTDVERAHGNLLSSVLPFAFSIRNEWRHKISHVDNQLVWLDTDFSPGLAMEIITAVRGFMKKLAADLP